MPRNATNQPGKRVLFVVSSYRPAMLADMQRARMLAWELPELGWNVEVLTPASTEVRQDALEPDPNSFFAPDTPIHAAGSLARGLFRAIGSSSPALRTLWPIAHRGSALLSTRRFNLVYFSTTTFSYFALGPFWRRKHGVPYVLDIQDPWVRDYGVSYTTTKHTFKLQVSRFLAKPLEKFAVKGAAGLVSVSPSYIEQLRQRYPSARCLREQRAVVIPFGATERDLSASSQNPFHETSTLPIVYVGAGGSIMAKSFTHIIRLMRPLALATSPSNGRVMIFLYGTDGGWQAGMPKYLEDLAAAEGAADILREQPTRITYMASLRKILEAAGLLILGVDDPAYMPSKLFTYSLTGKPLLVCLHRNSQANLYFEKTPGIGHLIHFGGQPKEDEERDRENVRNFLSEVSERKSFDRRAILEPYLSLAAARRHAECFEQWTDSMKERQVP